MAENSQKCQATNCSAISVSLRLDFSEIPTPIMDPEAIGKWLKTPNKAFASSTPLQVIERGETDRIWRMIYLVETGEPI